MFFYPFKILTLEKTNGKLKKTVDWFKTNKFSINKKTKNTLFSQKSGKDIKRKTAIMFLGEMLDENTIWIDNICIVETKLAKYI